MKKIAFIKMQLDWWFCSSEIQIGTISSVFSTLWYIMQTRISRIKHQAYSRFRFPPPMWTLSHDGFLSDNVVSYNVCCFQKNFPPHSLVSLNWGSATRISEEDRRRKRSLPNNPLNYQVCCLHVNFVSDPVMIMILSNKSEIETKYSKIVGRNICSISIHTSILYITAVFLTRWKLLIFFFIIVIIIPIKPWFFCVVWRKTIRIYQFLFNVSLMHCCCRSAAGWIYLSGQNFHFIGDFK